MDSIRFGTDGWRAPYGSGYSEENVARVTDAAARILAESDAGATMYIGYDTRCNARRYAEVAAGVVAARGLRAVLSDSYCPTPALGWTVAQDPDAVGGLMLTGSHAEAGYGGIKVRMADGGAAPKDVTDAIERAVAPDAPFEAGCFETLDIMTPYLERLKALVDGEAIRNGRLKIVCDPMHGTSCGYLVRLLRELGVEAAEIHNGCGPDFEGLTPEPVEPYTAACQRMVVQSEAHAGLLNDGDSDRIGAVDENGNVVSPTRS